jgi:hypothetical protein
MSYIETLKKNNADKLWCGKASTYDCLLGLLHAIETENWDSTYPESENLYNFLVFVENDNSNRFFSRLKELNAPPNTGRVPLSDAKSNLLVKLLVNRLDTVCMDYFHSNNSSEWAPRNTYGEKLLGFWKTFNNDYIKQVMEFVKTHKCLEKESTEETPETKLEKCKNMASTLKGAWAAKLTTQIQKLEEEVTSQKKVEKVDKPEKTETSTKVATLSKKVIVKRDTKTKKSTTTQQSNDDGQGNWVKVTNKRKTQHKH